MIHDDVPATVERILAKFEPMISSHNGAIKLVKIEDDIVYVKLDGACSTCPSSLYTVTFGIEEALREQLPHIKGVMPMSE